MLGCCKKVNIVQHIEKIEIDTHTYCITIIYCENCGSVKATTNVRQIKNGNKTEY